MKMIRRMAAFAVAALAASVFTLIGVPASAAPTATETMSVVSDATWTVDGTGTSVVVTCQDPWGISFGSAQWVWDRACPLTGSSTGEHHVFTKSFSVPGTVVSASLSYTIDNHGAASVNGQQAGTITNWGIPVTNLDVTTAVQSGANTLTIDATDEGGIAAFIANLTVTYTPLNVVETKDDCKKGGWADVTREDGSGFKNQGDCVSYVASGGRSDAR